jgi:hypothetical protein
MVDWNMSRYLPLYTIYHTTGHCAVVTVPQSVSCSYTRLFWGYKAVSKYPSAEGCIVSTKVGSAACTRGIKRNSTSCTKYTDSRHSSYIAFGGYVQNLERRRFD